MSVITAKSSKSAGGNLRYILDGQAHNNKLTSHRYLNGIGHNVGLDYAKKLNSRYLTYQYEATRKRALNQNKKTQSIHLIFSFSKNEFDGSDLKLQSKQMLQLVNGGLKERLPQDSQFVLVSQADGKGEMMHCHAVVNSVNLDGKVLNTNLVSMTGKDNMRDFFDNYFESNFQKVTGRSYQPIISNKDNHDLESRNEYHLKDRGAYQWKEDIKTRIVNAFSDLAQSNKEVTESDFESSLNKRGVSITRRHVGVGTDENGHKIKRESYTYSFDDVNGKQHKIKDYSVSKNGKVRGLGLDYTTPAIKKEIQSLNTNRKLIDDEEEDELNFEIKEMNENGINGQQANDQIDFESVNELGQYTNDGFDVSSSARRIKNQNRQSQINTQRKLRQREINQAENASIDEQSEKHLRKPKSKRPSTIEQVGRTISKSTSNDSSHQSTHSKDDGPEL